MARALRASARAAAAAAVSPTTTPSEKSAERRFANRFFFFVDGCASSDVSLVLSHSPSVSHPSVSSVQYPFPAR
jgi:hypothetical protein